MKKLFILIQFFEGMDFVFIIVIISIIGPIIGSLIGVSKLVSKKLIFHLLAFAAGMMIAISLLELIPEAIEYSSILVAALGILVGSITMYFLDKSIPHFHPEPNVVDNKSNLTERLRRSAKYLIWGIFIHNFPEGMAIATIQDPSISITIAIAIAVHNIPEGICTSAPYYAATGKKLKSFLISSSTAIPVILGFLTVRFLFSNVSEVALGFIAAATAGLMIYISADELIPSSCSKVCNHRTIFSFMGGIIFVVILLLL